MSKLWLASRGDSEPIGGKRSTPKPIGERPLGRFPRACRVINRLAFLAMIVFSLSVLLSIAAPLRYRIGPVSVSFDGVLKSVLEWIAAYVVWRSTYDGFAAWLRHWSVPLERQLDKVGTQIRAAAPRLRDQWRRWNWRQRLVLMVVTSQVTLSLWYWDRYPRELEGVRNAAEWVRQFPFYDPDGQPGPNFEYFCERIRESTPPDARILFSGGSPAVRLAYIVYPRKIYLLPHDYSALVASCLEPYWQRFLPHKPVDQAQFIREHGITHLAVFDGDDISRCRLEAVR